MHCRSRSLFLAKLQYSNPSQLSGVNYRMHRSAYQTHPKLLKRPTNINKLMKHLQSFVIYYTLSCECNCHKVRLVGSNKSERKRK